MNVLLPSAPSGAKGVQGAAEGGHGQQEMEDGAFAALLAEAVGESGEEPAADAPKAKKSEEMASAFRLVRRFETRAAPKGEGTELLDELTKEVAEGTRTKDARRADDKTRGKEATVGEKLGRVDAPPTQAPSDGVTSIAALEVLAALGLEVTPRAEGAPPPETAALMRKLAGALEADGLRGGKNQGGDLGGETEEGAEIVPVRVLRQEKHFQAAGVEARRWQMAQDAFAEARAALAAAVDGGGTPAAGESKGGERPGVPLSLARTAEPAAPAAAAAPAVPDIGIEVMPGAVGLQIADGIEKALGSPAEVVASQPAAPGLDIDTRQGFAPAIRTIKLELTPGDLGTVTVVVSGNEEGIRIEVAAELADTVNKVDSDRAVLTARLNGAGYSVTEISVARFAGQSMDSNSAPRDQGQRQGGLQEQLAGGSGGAREGGGSFAGQEGRRAAFTDMRGDMAAGAARGSPAGSNMTGVSYASRFRPV